MKRFPDGQPETAADTASLLAGLADPLRLRLARLVEQRELTVGELAKVVQSPQSTVSRHLKALADAGWLSRRAEGAASLYRLVLDTLPTDARDVWLAVRQTCVPQAVAQRDRRRLDAVLAERRTDSRSFFGRVGGEWDSVRRDLFGRGFTPVALLALLDPGWTVADLGCGTGNVAERLAPFVRRVIAVDQSDAMLDAARARLAPFGNVEFLLGDLDDLPIEGGTLDAAVFALVLHHLDEPGRALAQARRALKPGGIALVIDMDAHEHEEYRRTMGHVHLGFTRDAMSALFSDAGFVDIRAAPLPSDPDARGPGLTVTTGRRPPSD
ncbi:MAG: methyltransferase domain-containing protein [Planctomycetota bacterium]|nr:MAG: methyltransferase domain-containing protein [Planctomycetota bacterium]